MSTIINQTEKLLDKVLVDWVSKVFIDGKLTLTDMHKNTNLDEIKKNTGCSFLISDNMKFFEWKNARK